jgi:hypothetical protein
MLDRNKLKNALSAVLVAAVSESKSPMVKFEKAVNRCRSCAC